MYTQHVYFCAIMKSVSENNKNEAKKNEANSNRNPIWSLKIGINKNLNMDLNQFLEMELGDMQKPPYVFVHGCRYVKIAMHFCMWVRICKNPHSFFGKPIAMKKSPFSFSHEHQYARKNNREIKCF